MDAWGVFFFIWHQSGEREILTLINFLHFAFSPACLSFYYLNYRSGFFSSGCRICSESFAWTGNLHWNSGIPSQCRQEYKYKNYQRQNYLYWIIISHSPWEVRNVYINLLDMQWKIVLYLVCCNLKLMTTFTVCHYRCYFFCCSRCQSMCPFWHFWGFNIRIHRIILNLSIVYKENINTLNVLQNNISWIKTYLFLCSGRTFHLICQSSSLSHCTSPQRRSIASGRHSAWAFPWDMIHQLCVRENISQNLGFPIYLIFFKWRNFHLIIWIRGIGQNHSCMNRIQLDLQLYTRTRTILV